MISNIFLSNYRKFLLIINVINHIFSFEHLPEKKLKKSKIPRKSQNNETILSENNQNLKNISNIRPLNQFSHKKFKYSKDDIDILFQEKKYSEVSFKNIAIQEIISSEEIHKIKKPMSAGLKKNLNIKEKTKINDKNDKNKLIFSYFEFLKYHLKKTFKMKFTNKENLIHLSTKQFYFQMDLLTILKKLNGIVVVDNFPKRIIRNPKYLNNIHEKMKNEKNKYLIKKKEI